MKLFLNGTDAANDLHDKGFTNDFQLAGKDSIWVQEKILILVGQFTIVQCHCVIGSKNIMDKMVIYGIMAPYHKVKEILIKPGKNSTHYIYDGQTCKNDPKQHFK